MHKSSCETYLGLPTGKNRGAFSTSFGFHQAGYAMLRGISPTDSEHIAISNRNALGSCCAPVAFNCQFIELWTPAFFDTSLFFIFFHALLENAFHNLNED